MRIQKLSSQVSDKIAAGEVIERPASVVKELVENAVDAGADKIHVEIRAAGKELIRISDNGCGIHKEDARLAFERHATGKIKDIEDVYRICTMGFRGEALSSIAAVSRVELISRCEEDAFAYCAVLEDGVMSSFKPTGANRGTSISVKDLFYNTPARFAFLKSDRYENNAIREMVDKLAIANPQISFSLSFDNQLLYRTDGRGKLLNTLHRIYGDEWIKGLVEVDFREGDVKMSGYLSSLDVVKGTKKWQMVFINRRYVSDNLVEQKINEYFSKMLGSGKFPVFVINVELPANKVDVNIHPTKREVLFKDGDRMEMLTLKMLDDVFSKVDMSVKLHVPNQNQAIEDGGESTKVQDLYVAQKCYAAQKPLKKEDVIDNLYKSFYQKGQSQYVLPNEEDRNSKQKGSAPEYSEREFFVAHPEEFYEVETSIITGANPKTLDLEERTRSLESSDLESEDDIQALEGFDAALFFEEVRSKRQEQMELNVDMLTHSNVYEGMNVVAQVFESYILTSSGEDLYFINQHHAHERILYEAVIHAIKRGKSASQILLMMEKLPESLELSEEEIVFFKRFGIVMEAYPNGIYLKELPIIANKVLDLQSAIAFVEGMHFYFSEHRDLNPCDLSFDTLEQYYEEMVYNGLEGMIRKEIAKMVCNMAVKENQLLTHSDMIRILEGLKNVTLPYTSVHGKAMLTKLNKHEIFQKGNIR